MRNKKVIVYFSLFLILFLLFGTIKKKIDQNERNEYGVISIAKTGDFKGSKGCKLINFIYFVNDKMYSEDCYVNNYPNVKKGEFYKIIYSSRNPKNVEIFLNKKIMDSTLIDNAGLNLKRKIKDLYK